MPPVFSMFWGPITPERIVLAGIITLGSGIQLMVFARRVYKAREKHHIEYPAVTGNPEFERIYSAHQDALAWHPIFMATLWTSALFFHQVPAAICGLLYMISRQRSFNGCTQSVEQRLPGFYRGFRILSIMGIMAAVGMGRTLVRAFLILSHRHGGPQGMPHPWRFGQNSDTAGMPHPRGFAQRSDTM